MSENARRKPDTLAYSIRDVIKAGGPGKTKLFEAIKAKQLPVRYIGRRVLILRNDLEAYLQSLPTENPNK